MKIQEIIEKDDNYKNAYTCKGSDIMKEQIKSKKIKLRGGKSLGNTIEYLSGLLVIIVVAISILVTIPNYRENIKLQVKNNMENLITSYGMLVDATIDSNGTLSEDDARELLSDVKIQGLQSSYTYLVSCDGTMIYHPTTDKIGKPVENSVVHNVVEELKNGNIPDNKVVEYDFRGVKKYAGYYISPKDKCILIVTADESEILKPIKIFIIRMIVIQTIILILVILISKLIINKVIKPLKRLKKLAEKTAEYDLKDKENFNDIISRRDEIGEIGRAFVNMRKNLRSIVSQIDNTSKSISKSAEDIEYVTNIISENSSNNSSVTEELAAGMEETTRATSNISESALSIDAETKDINTLAEEGLKTSREVFFRADDINKNIDNKKKIARKLCEEVNEKTEIAINEAKSVDKINELASAIKAITTQTSMLSLNASIEAARAGEYGKGFAVVADEISNLANQSAETVGRITEIVEDVHMAVRNMTDCMNQTMNFLKENVFNDYEEFSSVGNQYRDDAKTFEKNAKDISSSINMLSSEIGRISEAIAGMNTTINNSTNGVKDIAEKTSNIVTSLDKAYDSVKENIKYSNDLESIVDKFEL